MPRTKKLTRAGLLLGLLTPGISAVDTCFIILTPGTNAVCNVAPGSTANLQTEIIIGESAPGVCAAADTPFGGQYFELEKAIYTGLNSIVTTASALNTVSDITPALTGTYTFSYGIPHASILGGSPVTRVLYYSIPGFGIFASTTNVFTEVHLPTIVSTASTTTLTTPLHVTAGSFYSHL